MSTVNVTLQVTRADTLETIGGYQSITVGTHRQAGVVSVGTSEETISVLADIGDAGLMYVHNLDDTNYVDIGFATGDYPLRVYADQPALIPLAPSTSTIYVLANTAAVDLQYEITERA